VPAAGIPEVLQGLLRTDRLLGFEVEERFYEVGSPEEIEQIERFILRQPASALPSS
jgi:hypothetical protein